MIESPLIQDIVHKSERTGQVKSILHLLKGKFGDAGPNVTAGLGLVKEEAKLLRLLSQASSCASLQAFEDALREELPKPPPASTRGKRKPRKEKD